MQSELNEFLESHDSDSIEKIDDSTVFKARLNLAPSAFVDINRQSVDFFKKHAETKQWNGFDLIDVDGTTLRLPANEDVAALFPPQPDAQGNPTGPPLARLNLLYDPLNNLCLSADLDNIEISEMDQLIHQEWQWSSGQLLLADRHYDAFWLFVWLLQKEADFCIRMRLDNRPVVQRFAASGAAEQIVELNPGRSAKSRCRKRNLPTQPVEIRLIRVTLPDGKFEVLATSLLRSETVSANEFKELYHLRWPVEEKFKQLKHRVNLENWSGKGPLSVIQDVHARLWATNLTVLMAKPLEAKIKARTATRKYNYQINWANALASMKRWMQRLFSGRKTQFHIEALSERILTNLSPIRPDRKNPRNPKTHQREFHMSYKLCF